ncbi:MAG: hypothetical protein FWC39_12020 [Bacteroidetes bacterium]|nr:hypothetical protein [Bacteroidota bacterium]
MTTAVKKAPARATSLRVRNSQIDGIYMRLKKDFPEVLESELRRIDALLSLSRLSGTIIPNKITMNEIVDEVNIVRAKRYAQRSSI